MPRKRVRNEIEAGGLAEVDALDEVEDRQVVLWPMLLGTMLRQIRLDVGLSQADLSERLNWPQSQLSKIESGEVVIAVDHLAKIIRQINGAGRTANRRYRLWHMSSFLEIAEEIVRELRKQGIILSWATGRAYTGDLPLLEGRALQDLVLDIWEDLP